MKKVVFKISAIVSMSLMLGACGEKKPDAPNPATIPVPVNLVELHPQQALYYDQFPANVVAMMQVDIRPQTEGYVTGIFFKEGSHVRKGERLYEIDQSKYRASEGQSDANIKVAEANLQQAQQDADRYTFLNEHDAVAKQTLDHALTTLQNAKNQLAAAKQDKVKTQTDLKYSVITAPFDGTIGISMVKVGASVVTGQTILNTISTDDPVAVDFVVNEKQIPKFIKMQQSKTAMGDSTFTLLLPDNTPYGIPGEIYFIDRGVNPQTGTLTIRLKFSNPQSLLRPGMSCKVLVRNQDTSQQLIIPNKAVVEQMGEYFVYVAKDSVTANGKMLGHAQQKKVLLGTSIADKIIVRKGLEDGDRIIVDGVQKMHDKTLINY